MYKYICIVLAIMLISCSKQSEMKDEVIETNNSINSNAIVEKSITTSKVNEDNENRIHAEDTNQINSTATLDNGVFAKMETNRGTILLRLYYKQVPYTVANFVGLAEGDREWKNPKTGEMKKNNFYDGLKFHRVINNFMIQGGDPLGSGRGGPGYKFADEFTEHTHVIGAISMANAGPNANGSQFFITYTPQHHLDGHHSVFGQLVDGMDVLKEIVQGDAIIRIAIEEK